jgi:biopolymer transport protein ExbD
MSSVPGTDNLEIPEVVEQAPKKKRQKLGRSEITMNLVAMLDLSFNILIFFIITANFAVHEGVITAKVPSITGTGQKKEDLALPETPLKIVLSATSGSDGQARINIEGASEQTQDFSRLSEVLARIQNNKENPNGTFKDTNPVIITPDKNTRWQDVVNAFNAVVKARYSNVSFGPISSSEEGGG